MGIIISRFAPLDHSTHSRKKKRKIRPSPPALTLRPIDRTKELQTEVISSLYPFKITSAPTPNFSTSAFSNLLVLTLITLTPLLSLTSSCAPTQHFAINFFAISTPPGTPAEILPPNHHGFWTRSNECRRHVSGRQAVVTR